MMANIQLIMDTSPLFFSVLAILAIAVLGHILLWATSFIFSFIGAMQARRGQIFNYPFSLEIFK